MTCDLGVVLELAGGFAATALAYIFREVSLLLLCSTHKLMKHRHSCGVLPQADEPDSTRCVSPRFRGAADI